MFAHARHRALAAGLSLYLVADPTQTSQPVEEIVDKALSGGVTAVQLRVKSLTDSEVVALARRLRSICDQAGALFLVNDRVDVALAANADGVHLGVDDLPLEDARRILGPNYLIGYSPENDDQVEAARRRGADYLGVGPVFETSSKSDAGSAIGIETVRRRAALAGIPLIGIGGITAANAGSIIKAGAVGVAVVSAVLRAIDPRIAAEELRAAVQAGIVAS